ncbi:DUF4232 domain-containing protein [Amycolatopsis rhabdoformis]|uniref:DUF4232 domain-containing protein n=1 Tax=Amycolatopsis rhabdoformis TaxID=1448059 RepID=A0ABZ1HZL3_9PSEU|nr:DUF4232 domain-containing protein [Amycolatopsis rhabdoformis]WSE26815.1 DUF4232 domain-containing protein [Amycolatopsis rhabdoformis]
MRVNTIVQGAAGIAVLFALTACSSAPAPQAAAAPPQSPSAATAQPTNADKPASVVRQNDNAAKTSFHAELTIQDQGLGLLALENTGKTPVTIQGWPTLRFLAADNSPLKVPTQNVDIPGAGPSITLRPGTNAFAGVKWETGDKGSTDTFVSTTLELTPPHATTSTVVDVIGTDGKKVAYPELDLTSVKVGTLQPSTQGVLVF